MAVCELDERAGGGDGLPQRVQQRRAVLSGYVCCAAFGGACAPSNECPASSSGGGTAGGTGGGTGGGVAGGTGGSGGGSISVGTPGDGGIPALMTCTPPGTYAPVNAGVAGPATDPDANGACQKPVGSSSISTGLQEDFGAHTVGDVLTFTVPPNTASITIVQQAITAIDSVTYSSGGQTGSIDNFSAPTDITLPDGGVIYSDGDQEAGQNLAANESTDPVWDVLGQAVTGAITIPQHHPQPDRQWQPAGGAVEGDRQ